MPMAVAISPTPVSRAVLGFQKDKINVRNSLCEVKTCLDPSIDDKVVCEQIAFRLAYGAFFFPSPFS